MFCKAEYFEKKKKRSAYFDFDSTILHARFLYVRLDKKNVFLTNPAKKSESLFYTRENFISARGVAYGGPEGSHMPIKNVAAN